MPKTKVNPVQGLTEEIAQLEEAIATAERDLIEQQCENEQMKEAFQLLSSPAAKYVPSGQVLMMDAIVNLLDEATDQSDRNYRWGVAQQAYGVGQQAASSLQNKINQLRQKLAIATEELDWQTNYAPYLEKYRPGFSMLSPEGEKEQQIASIKKDIAEKKNKLERLKAWLAQPQGDRDYLPFVGQPEALIEYLRTAIPVLENQLNHLIAKPAIASFEYESKLREYVKARVHIEADLNQFLEAQNKYLVVLEAFKKAIAKRPTAVEFPVVALELPRIVEAETSIKFAPSPVTKTLR